MALTPSCAINWVNKKVRLKSSPLISSTYRTLISLTHFIDLSNTHFIDSLHRLIEHSFHWLISSTYRTLISSTHFIDLSNTHFIDSFHRLIKHSFHRLISSTYRTLSSSTKSSPNLTQDQRQGCQMVYFQNKNPNLGKFWRALEWKRLLYYLAVWNILQPFRTYFGHLVIYLVAIRNIFPPFWYIVSW
jgi:hypothetical protein